MKKDKKERSFVQNVMILMSGSAASQAIALVFSIYVARIYSKADFATFEQFTMFISVIGVIAGGRYDAAVMLPKKDGDSLNMVRLSIKVAFISCLILTAIAIFTAEPVTEWMQNPGLSSHLWLIGPVSFLMVVASAYNFWFSRKKLFSASATGRGLFSLLSEPAKILFGWMQLLNFGLIYGVIVGHVTKLSYYFYRYRKSASESDAQSEISASQKELALEYSDYPKYSLPGSLLNRAAQWIHILLFPLLFGQEGLIAIGFISLSRRIILNPLSMLSQAYSQVYFQKITEIDDPDALKKNYFRQLPFMMGIAILVIVVMWVIPDSFWTFIFSEKWSGLNQYLRILSLWFAMNFVVSAFGFILHRLRKQKTILQLDILHFLIISAALILAGNLNCDVFQALEFFVGAKVLYYIISLVLNARFISKGRMF